MSLLGAASALRRIAQSAHLDRMGRTLGLPGLCRPPDAAIVPGAFLQEESVRTSLVVVLVVVLGVLAAACGGEGGTAAPAAVIETVSPADAAALIDSAPPGLVVLDVRTPDEFGTGHLAGAVNLDYYAADFGDRLAAFDRLAPYVIYCRTGNRSGEVREMMRGMGFLGVTEIGGGIVAWAEAGLPFETP
ncbi:MAG: rhodanese-like domain-containing protein [Actinobacteria bacterium]|nr:rhodanese-like domain-containing protein [Actinomycetota bacterium]